MMIYEMCSKNTLHDNNTKFKCCPACRAQGREYVLKHRKRLALKNKQWIAANPEKNKATRKKYRKNNKKALAAYQRKYYAKKKVEKVA